MYGNRFKSRQLREPRSSIWYNNSKTSLKTTKPNQNPTQLHLSWCSGVLYLKKDDFVAWALELVCRSVTISVCFPSNPRSIRELRHTLLAKKHIGLVLTLGSLWCQGQFITNTPVIQNNGINWEKDQPSPPSPEQQERTENQTGLGHQNNLEHSHQF